jgi:BirA family biotin operon repressor/biotin-[acetyl-CoA-carboxylase] ligase
MQLQTIQWHDSLESTNVHLRTLLAADAALPSGTMVAAHQQTAGRGRYDRVWLSSPGMNLTFSILLRPDVPQSWLPSLTMAVALGISKALSHLGISAQLKWPNDVRVNGKKICGILSEYVPGPGQTTGALIVGIGLNVNMTVKELGAIDQPATSIYAETDTSMNIFDILALVLEQLPESVDLWEQGGFEAIRKKWIAQAEGLGHAISVGTGERAKTGTLTGFGPYGELLLCDCQGQEHILVLGDMTLC